MIWCDYVRTQTVLTDRAIAADELMLVLIDPLLELCLHLSLCLSCPDPECFVRGQRGSNFYYKFFLVNRGKRIQKHLKVGHQCR